MGAKRRKPSLLTNEELEKRWSEFIASGETGIEASELRNRAVKRYHRIILKKRAQARLAVRSPFEIGNSPKSKFGGKYRNNSTSGIGRNVVPSLIHISDNPIQSVMPFLNHTFF
jgi:hypothetical protein